MRFPRFSIAGLMALILIVALDCVGVGLIGADPWGPRVGGSRPLDLDIKRRATVAATVLPMVNALAIVGVWGRRRPGRMGFLIVGGLAVVVGGVRAATLAPGWPDVRIMHQWAGSFAPRIDSILMRLPPRWQEEAARVLACVVVNTPAVAVQLGVALLGWRFDRRFEIRRRPRAETLAVGTGVAREV